MLEKVTTEEELQTRRGRYLGIYVTSPPPMAISSRRTNIGEIRPKSITFVPHTRKHSIIRVGEIRVKQVVKSGEDYDNELEKRLIGLDNVSKPRNNVFHPYAGKVRYNPNDFRGPYTVNAIPRKVPVNETGKPPRDLIVPRIQRIVCNGQDFYATITHNKEKGFRFVICSIEQSISPEGEKQRNLKVHYEERANIGDNNTEYLKRRASEVLSVSRNEAQHISANHTRAFSARFPYLGENAPKTEYVIRQRAVA